MMKITEQEKRLNHQHLNILKLIIIQKGNIQR